MRVSPARSCSMMSLGNEHDQGVRVSGWKAPMQGNSVLNFFYHATINWSSVHEQLVKNEKNWVYLEASSNFENNLHLSVHCWRWNWCRGVWHARVVESEWNWTGKKLQNLWGPGQPISICSACKKFTNNVKFSGCSTYLTYLCQTGTYLTLQLSVALY